MEQRYQKITIEISRMFLLLLWSYAVLSKLLDPFQTRSQLHNQVFSSVIADVLFYLLPILESLAIILLLIKVTRIWGFLGSFLLMTAFTGYIILVKIYYFGRIPCSCGGLISGFNWTQHLLFNILFLGLSLLGLILTIKERRIYGQTT